MAWLSSVLEAVGHTPLVELTRIGAGLDVRLLAKLELVNPGGSVKDRVAVAMIADAEERGLLAPGGTIVEATAGNTGVGLAMAAARKGYRCVFVMPDKMSADKIRLLEAYGAEVVVTATDVAPDSPSNYNQVADRLAREIPDAWRPNQFANPRNPEAHYRTTGPEIWEDTEGQVDCFVAGMGTGGTISGTSRFLKERNPALITVGADPEGSILSGGTPQPWKVEGIGEDFVPATFDRQMVDDMVRVSDADSFAAARRLAREEGILAGGSAGTALAAAISFAPRLPHDSVVVVLLPDTGRNYLSKVFSDSWMADNGFLAPSRESVEAGAVLAAKRHLPPLISVRPSMNALDAARMMESYAISQIPVLRDGIAVGSLDEGRLVHLLHEGTDLRQHAVEDVMGPRLPEVGEHQDVSEVYRLLLSGHGGVVITREGMALGFLSQSDLLEFWSERVPSHREIA